MKKYLTYLVLIPITLLLSACGNYFKNKTASTMMQNPSGIYRLEAEIDPSRMGADPLNFKPYVVIEGQKHAMKAQGTLRDYVFDFNAAPGQEAIKYYYGAEYLTNGVAGTSQSEKRSDLFETKILSRYVLNMESDRGPVGAEVAVMGKGFTEFDKVFFEHTQAETLYDSSNVIRFKVPPIRAEEYYPVFFDNGTKRTKIGDFFIDGSRIHANRDSILLTEDEKTLIVFQVDQEAPTGGIELDITTDIPRSVIMPEASIEAGSRSVNVMIQGGQAGEGSLFVTARGFDELEIPVNVKERAYL